MATPIPNAPTYPEIPDKLYFRIGEVSRLANVKPYVLRYWETEFASIGPKKSGSNHRLYRRKDVELILEIKHLLYEKRYTIEGARKQLLDQARIQVRAEPRAMAKPVQAASAVASAMAMAVGAGSSSSTTISSAASGPSSSTHTAPASKTKSTAAAKPAVPADLVGSIRRELLSLLDLLSH